MCLARPSIVRACLSLPLHHSALYPLCVLVSISSDLLLSVRLCITLLVNRDPAVHACLCTTNHHHNQCVLVIDLHYYAAPVCSALVRFVQPQICG
ncbi:hypothetical protein Syun_021144 [Stephania yunnanensis]|uniref:Uncharacterized protein n=1 Tax=Stephania yunnanensis TaxID=152371 RepID=A0AAP0IH38_9MAGN